MSRKCFITGKGLVQVTTFHTLTTKTAALGALTFKKFAFWLTANRNASMSAQSS